MKRVDFIECLCAHRGYHNPAFESDPKRFLENTLPAFERGWEFSELAECDVQMTVDGKIIVAHDRTLWRVAAVSDKVDSAEGRGRSASPGGDLGELGHILELEGRLLTEESLAEKLRDPLYGRLWESSMVSEEEPSGLEEVFLARLPLRLLTLHQIRRVRLKRGATVPLLEDLLELLEHPRFASKELVIEMKQEAMNLVEPLVELLDEKRCWKRVYVMSFDSAMMSSLRQIEEASRARRPVGAVLRSFWLVCTSVYANPDPNPMSLLTTGDEAGELMEALRKIGVGGVYLEYRAGVVTSSLVERLCGAGYSVGIWSGRPEYEIPSVVRAMVEAGVSIFNTDEPDELAGQLRAGGEH